MTTRLQKFIERGDGDGSGRAPDGRHACALPRPALRRKEWRRINSFSDADEVLNDPDLQSTFKMAIDTKALWSAQRGRRKMTGN